MARRPLYLDLSAELDLRKLRYFLAVAHHLNFGRASEELLLAQPALSRAIQSLETDLGVTLFERDHHKVTLTPPGAALVREAETLLARAAAARRHVQAEPHRKHPHRRLPPRHHHHRRRTAIDQ